MYLLLPATRRKALAPRSDQEAVCEHGKSVLLCPDGPGFAFCPYCTTHNTNIYAPREIRTRNPKRQAAADPRLRPPGHHSNPGPPSLWRVFTLTALFRPPLSIQCTTTAITLSPSSAPLPQSPSSRPAVLFTWMLRVVTCDGPNLFHQWNFLSELSGSCISRQSTVYTLYSATHMLYSLLRYAP
jgi:hypothetical protein